ncbi:hypothetical protein BZA05DRAFT_458492 [Tricharina praecox]|uniref:uncharacterized protein n=1 Tax=Tricharina praecox TaxID=43433 RepID=UPI00221EB742|nr:uncharacterized protein BZA05DRAFT_458492 [Tricharina praecox]KAI5846109.1 hypothetical protein BZA05DRAFT_458492 [Tricharina praecox]
MHSPKKLLAITIALTLTTAFAQIPDLPACSSECLLTKIIAAGCSLSPPDASCICQDAGYLASIKTCVPTKCPKDDVAKIIAYVNEQCSGQEGFPLSMGGAAAPSASATSAAADSTATATAAGGNNTVNGTAPAASAPASGAGRRAAEMGAVVLLAGMVSAFLV